MANNNTPFEKQLNNESVFKSDLLSGFDKPEWPTRIDYVAKRVSKGDYAIGLGSGDPTYLSGGYDLEKAAREYYLRGIAALTGEISRQTALPDSFPLGDLLVEFAGLSEGLEHVDRRDVPPGEILSRIIMRTVKRQADDGQAQLAQQLRADSETPRELVAELTTVPELAPLVESAIPDPEDPATLTTKLASLDLTTKLWDHQLESLALWLHHGMNAYVDMATATGKTVLGLAAVAHAVDSGSLHPSDQDRLEEIFDGDLPDPHRNRPNDVLIVTTDDLLGVQWARLFQDHCHTPPAFTQIQADGIQLPWGRIDIRSASGLADVEPSNYRLAIFDEVHNYSGRSGWGSHLVEFVESACPVLALTGSVTDELESFAARSDRPFPLVYRYTHELALADGVIPDFEWTLQFADVDETKALDQFRETAALFDGLVEYDGKAYRLSADALSEAAPTLDDSDYETMAGEYVSGSALATGLRDAGDSDIAPTDELESLASGISNRTIHRLNLRADLEPVVDLAEAALSEGRPVLILTRSYGEAKEIWQTLYDRHDDRVVRKLDADQDAAEQDATIQAFDEADTDQKALIGPGKRIGQGNDIKSVEVGINISRPGSGVNTTLVQRLGRLLRDAGGKETVDFYHVIGIPPADTTIKPDGESFVRTVAEFFGQVLEPDTDGILKPPSVAVRDTVGPDIVALEEQGMPCIHSDDQSTVIESAYATAIDERSEENSPTVTTDWFSAAFGEEAQPSVQSNMSHGQMNSSADSHTKSSHGDRTDTDSNGDTQSVDETGKTRSETDAITNTDSNVPEESDDTIVGEKPTDNLAGSEEDRSDEETVSGEQRASRDVDQTEHGEDENGLELAEYSSPLAEHYDAFRSLGVIHRALRKSAQSDIPESDPLRRWMEDIRAIISEQGYGNQEIGYGKQQATRSPFSMEAYREEYGTGDRVTDFNTISVNQPPAVITVLLDPSLDDLSSWVVPVAPESEVPLPVVVESEAELDRARRLLGEFKAEPPISADELDTDEEDGASSAEEMTDDDPTTPAEPDTSTPVEAVRGVTDSAAVKLREAGYERLVDLQRASDEELLAVSGISDQRIQLIRATIGSR